MLKKRYSSASQLDGFVDTEKLRSGSASSLERDPAKFLALTYPTEDVHNLLRYLSRRFDRNNQSSGDSPGLVLAEGVKGQGKSHDLVLTYHRSEEHTSELQSRLQLVCRLLL